jgi:hypothetical protein
MSNSTNRIVSTEEQIFDSVKDAFINKMNYIAEKTGQYYPSLTSLTNLCCSEEEKEILLDLAIKIKENEDSIFGTTASFKDICYGVIYTYYGLNLTEDLSYFNISVLPRNSNNEIVFKNIERWTVNKEFNYWINTNTDNISMVYYLYIRLGMPSLSQPKFGDIITRDGENLSEKLRKFAIKGEKNEASSSPKHIKPAKSSNRLIKKYGGKKSCRNSSSKHKKKQTRRKRNPKRNK